ncbi:MAG: transposase [Alphaproteobacteria bacterium]|nr:transposase [Alphaproteobacteria bacterium]
MDASHHIAKASLWEERDKVLKQKYEKLNNEVLPKVAHDKQARIGCKGKNKYWYGYKKHISVDVQSGMINKVAITFAN